MGAVLTSERERYAQDGFLFPIPVLAPHEVERFRSASDELEERLGGRPRTVDVRQMHLHFRWAFELASHPRVLDAVEAVLGPDLLVWATELFAKHPDEEAVSIGWHRDEPYMGLPVEHTTTAWIALGESTAANGCMRVVRETVRRVPAGADERNAQPAEDDEVIDVVLAPGEMSLHNVRVLHGSGPNRSRGKRVGFVVRFVSPEARPLEIRPPAVLVRGRDSRGHFELLEPPLADDPEQAVGGLRASALKHLDAVLRNLDRCRC
jgi:ectoine hydroxylase-related dioxygenase (phytanoyl-CoA dioxygenase family)